MEFFMFDNQEEFYMIQGFFPHNIPAHFQPDLSGPTTYVSMNSHHILEEYKKGPKSCRDEPAFVQAKCMKEQVANRIKRNQCMTPWHWNITGSSREEYRPCSNASEAKSTDLELINYFLNLTYEMDNCPGMKKTERNFT